MADKKSDGVEVLSLSEDESKEQPSSKKGSVMKNGTAKTGKPKPKSSLTKEKKDDLSVVESSKKKSVIVIDLTDDTYDVAQESDEKVTNAPVPPQPVPPQPVIVCPIKLVDLKDKVVESVVELCQSSEAAFVGIRGEEKNGILELTLESDEDQGKALVTLEKVAVSEKRKLTATIKPLADSGLNQLLLKELQENVSGNDKELTSVFINNIPPEARPGILKLMFPTARNIQFPQDNDGNSQGYAVLEVAGRKSAEAIIKHHELYIPKIGIKVLKLHIVGETSTSESDVEIVLLDDKPEETTLKKDKDKVMSNTRSKTKQDSAKKPNVDSLAKKKLESSKAFKKDVVSDTKSENVKGDKNRKSTENKSDENRSRSRSTNPSQVSSQRRRNRSRSRDRRSSRERGRRSGSADRHDRRDNRSTGSRDGPSTRNPSREATRENRNPGSAARPSRWGITPNNQITDQNVSSQRTQSLSNNRVNQRDSSLTGLDGPHEHMLMRNADPAGMANRRGGMPRQVNRSYPAQTVPRQGNQNIRTGNTIGQPRNQMGEFQGIGHGRSAIEQRTPVGQRNAMAEQRNQDRERPTPLVGPGSQVIQPSPALQRHRNQQIGQRTPQVEKSNAWTSRGNHIVGQNSSVMHQADPVIAQRNMMGSQGLQMSGQNPTLMVQSAQNMGLRNTITRQGIQMMGQGGQMNAQGTSTVAQTNPIFGHGTSVGQQQNQLTGQGMNFSQMSGQRNQMMGQSNPMVGQNNPMTGQGYQMRQNTLIMGQGMGLQNQIMGHEITSMGQGNQMVGQGAQLMGQSNLMMGQQTSMAAQGNQMAGRGTQLMSQGSQMRQGLDVNQVLHSRSMTDQGSYGSALQTSMTATRGNLPVTTASLSLGRNAGERQGQQNMGSSPHVGMKDPRQQEMSQMNRGNAQQQTNRLSGFDNSKKRREDSQRSDSRSGFSNWNEKKDTSRSSRFDRSRSPVHKQSHEMEQRRGNRSQTTYDVDKSSDRPAVAVRRPSRFDDRGTGSRDRNKSEPGDRRRQYNREEPQQTQRGGSDVQAAPDLSNIRSQLMNTLRQLETGNISDTVELADIAEKIKLVQQQQQKQSNPQGTSGSRKSGDLYREEPRSSENSSYDRYNAGKGGSYEPRQGEYNTDRRTLRDSSDYGQNQPSSSVRQDDYNSRSSSSNRREDYSSKVTIDYDHQGDSRSRFRDQQHQRFPDTRIEKDYHSGGQAGQSDNYGSRDREPSRFGGRATNQRETIPDSNRDIQRQGYTSEDTRNRGRSQQFGSGDMNQRGAMVDSKWDLQRQGYYTDQGISDRSSINNFSSTSFSTGDNMGGHGIIETSDQNQSAFRNPPPWQKSINPPPLMSALKPAIQVAKIPERSKKVYVGNLPATAKWDEVAKFFNIEMWKRRMTSPSSLNKPVAGVVQAPDKSYAYVLFTTVEEAEGAVLLDGIRYENNILNIKSSMFTR